MLAGVIWKFGDNINTDLIVPGPVLHGTEEEQRRAIFSANRPGWVDRVGQGDVLVAGRNFGMGSSRPAPRSLSDVGIACLLADSLNGLFFRNSVNYGFLALECPGVHNAFEEGQIAEVSVVDWTVRNRESGQTLSVLPVPKSLLTLMQNGGIYRHLEQIGLLEPKA
jgi:3-isopropylmalate/(R)-2-methylmalate dehydratase small subunit